MKLRIAAAVAALGLIALSGPTLAAPRRPAPVTITIRVAEGYYPVSGETATIFYASEPCVVVMRVANPNAYEALIAGRANRCISSFTVTKTPPYGHYLTCVEGRCEQPGFYWAIYKNGSLTCQGVDDIKLANEDEIAFSFEAYPTALALGTCDLPLRLP